MASSKALYCALDPFNNLASLTIMILFYRTLFWITLFLT
ncbi:hypothetical protein CKA32_001209 [Geitlerinema sp. FC II]|nr:hypothetical protein CKA32_001209 [Geitlerinema sp. FC II]